MSAKQSGTAVQTQKSEPWDAQKPHLEEVFNRARANLDSSNPSYYPGQRIAGQSAATLDGMGSVEANARAGVGLTGMSRDLSMSTMNGDFLNNNPHLDATFNKGADAVRRQFQMGTSPTIDAGAANAGAGGFRSGAHALQRDLGQRAYGDTLNNLATDVYGGNYERERGRQDAAMGNAGNIFAQGLMPGQALAGVGAGRDARNQDLINADIEKFNFNQNLPDAKLTRYQQMVQGNYGGQATTSTPTFSNPFASILGAGLGIGSLASGFGGFGGFGGGKGGKMSNGMG